MSFPCSSVTAIRSSAVLVTLSTLSLYVSLAAAQAGSQTPQVQFNHLTQNADLYYEINLAHGDELIIEVQQTHPPSFAYEIRAAVFVPPTSTATAATTVAEADLETQLLRHTHDRRNGGYYVEIASDNPPEIDRADSSTTRLRSVQLLISVTTNEWEHEFAGAYTVSAFRDPVYFVETSEVTGGASPDTAPAGTVIAEDTDARDLVRLGVGAFTHLYNTRRPRVAWTFGLGTADGKRVTYYLGLSYRLGNRGAITGGLALGPLARLPDGVVTGSTVTDANLLSNLSTRVTARGFMAVSYSFLNSSADRLRKPFLGDAAAAASAPTPLVSSATTSSPPSAPTFSPVPNHQNRDTDHDGVLDIYDSDMCDPDNTNQTVARRDRDSDDDGTRDVADGSPCDNTVAALLSPSSHLYSHARAVPRPRPAGRAARPRPPPGGFTPSGATPATTLLVARDPDGVRHA